MNFRRFTHPGPTQNHQPLPSSGRAGRNLPAAIAVGVSMAAVALAALFLSRPVFVVLVCALAVVAMWELAGAFARKDFEIALAPAWVGGVGMLVSAWFLGLEAVLGALCLTGFAVTLWKLIDTPSHRVVNDVMVTIFVLLYVPLLASFVLLLLKSPHGVWAVFVYIALSVANDLGGWMAGVTLGKHPMAPRISPKKSWEGFAGSLALSIAVGIGGMLWLDGAWWWGIVLACLTTVAATTGDLVESLIKRDVGLKDMSNILPGHGGLMDRMDSLLMVAPAAYLVMRVALPW